jgi:hypothetical protein
MLGMNMPAPSASPSASPMGQMPGMEMPGVEKGSMNMNMGPLLVMNGDDMAFASVQRTNVTSMGAMGSGTAWQPSSARCTCSTGQKTIGC